MTTTYSVIIDYDDGWGMRGHWSSWPGQLTMSDALDSVLSQTSSGRSIKREMSATARAFLLEDLTWLGVCAYTPGVKFRSVIRTTESA